MKKLMAALVLMLALVIVIAAPAVGEGFDESSTTAWEQKLKAEGTNATCYWHSANKHGESTTAHGTSAGTSVTLYAFDQEWFGDHYALLVVLDSEAASVYPRPQAGVAYAAPGDEPLHGWIVCKGETPPPPVETTTTTEPPVETTTTMPATPVCPYPGLGGYDADDSECVPTLPPEVTPPGDPWREVCDVPGLGKYANPDNPCLPTAPVAEPIDHPTELPYTGADSWARGVLGAALMLFGVGCLCVGYRYRNEL